MALGKILLLGVLLLAASQADDDVSFPEGSIESRLFGGHDVTDDPLPYVVLITTFGSEGEPLNTCAGAIIAPLFVVTTGTCVYMAVTANLVAGTFDPTVTDTDNTMEGVQAVKSHSINIHPEFYINGRGNDIALILVKPAFDLELDPRKVALIPLPKASDVSKDAMAGKLTVAVSGWGLLNVDPGDEATKLQNIALIGVAKQENCKKVVKLRPHFYRIPDTSFCANTSALNVGMCKKDMGAPAVALIGSKIPIATLVGLGVESLGACPSRVPNIFVRVGDFNKWFTANGVPDVPK